MDTTEMQRLMTLPEVAERLKLSTRTVRRRIDEGGLPAVRLGPHRNSQIRVDEADLEAWLRS